ncbi:hypothetical protein [Burkholderia ubonensis]|uniref:hypothetical protein n=1 Tax=Burkholderia ubonensis TaxID=101571 RepID=UPI00075E7CF2|nr:hypothetical protein [Burkholderia ubonensis]KVA22976.1 hypothetical protein WI42_08185 [Burkholderia ubonensis]KVA27760.1 hypothetical protein WI43_05205 [Burkholderia ubonensis]KVA44374.1 hypothetical protein WI46_08910 [Burkholderia ubonensis]
MANFEKWQGRVSLFVVGLALAVALVAAAQQLYQGQLLTQSGLEQRLALKVLTYHHSNRWDQHISDESLLAGRGFVYFLAALCVGAVGASIGLGSSALRKYMVAYLAVVSILMFSIFYFSENSAYYIFG